MTDLRSTYSIVVVGGGGVGKSAVTIQFVQSHFIIEYDPTIEDSYRKQFSVDGVVCMLELLDTAGQEEFTAMRDQYMRTGKGFLCVFAINSRSSFDEISNIFIPQIFMAKDWENDVSHPILIVGNKADMEEERKVLAIEGTNLALRYSTKYVETSAKTRKNIDETFSEMVRIIQKCDPEKKHSVKKINKKCLIL